MMDVRPIHTEADYQWALKEVEHYFEHQPEPNTPEGDRFEVLCTLIEAYERKYFPIPETDPVDVLRFAIEEMGHSKKELDYLLGRSRAWEVLNRKRPLTLEMIRKISVAWHIPAGALTQSYKLAHEYA